MEYPPDYPLKCPTCLSAHPLTRGVIFPEGEESYQCRNIWHKGPAYSANILVLTEWDKKFLRDQLIGW